MKLLRDVYKSWNAEGTRSRPLSCAHSPLGAVADRVPVAVVFITSNYIGNSEMMEVGVPSVLSGSATSVLDTDCMSTF